MGRRKEERFKVVGIMYDINEQFTVSKLQHKLYFLSKVT